MVLIGKDLFYSGDIKNRLYICIIVIEKFDLKIMGVNRIITTKRSLIFKEVIF